MLFYVQYYLFYYKFVTFIPNMRKIYQKKLLEIKPELLHKNLFY